MINYRNMYQTGSVLIKNSNVSPALWFIFAASFYVKFLGKVPVGSESASNKWWINASQTGEWVKRWMTADESSLYKTILLFLFTESFSYKRILKQQSTYEHIEIAVLPSFTLPLTTSCLSCASLLPLPLLSAKAQHCNRCEPCRPGGRLGAPCTGRERAREWAHCSWRMRPVFHRQVRFCPKVVIRPHKHFIHRLLTCTHANASKHTLTTAALSHTLAQRHLREIAQESEAYLSCLA